MRPLALKENDTMAYLSMMAVRLLEVASCLKRSRKPVFALRPHRKPLFERSCSIRYFRPRKGFRDDIIGNAPRALLKESNLTVKGSKYHID